MMGKRTQILAWAVAGATWLSVSPASAQEFGTSGTLSVAVERVFGVNHTEFGFEATVINSVVEDEVSATEVNLLSNNSDDPFSATRVALDYFVADSISVGGAIAFTHRSQDQELRLNGVEQPSPADDGWAFLFAPRVGYAHMFNNTVGLWPRLGLSYVKIHQESETTLGAVPSTTELDAWFLAFSADVMLVISPIDHVAFLVGPTFDISFADSGDYDVDATSYELDNLSLWTFGLVSGLGVWF